MASSLGSFIGAIGSIIESFGSRRLHGEFVYECILIGFGKVLAATMALSHPRSRTWWENMPYDIRLDLRLTSFVPKVQS